MKLFTHSKQEKHVRPSVWMNRRAKGRPHSGSEAMPQLRGKQTKFDSSKVLQLGEYGNYPLRLSYNHVVLHRYMRQTAVKGFIC